MTPRTSILCAAAALTAAAGGCIDTDAAVFVDPSIESPSAQVAAGALGTELEARFTLKLHLGPRASGPSRVSVRSFEIVSADQKTSIVSPLAVETETELPVEVAPDSDVIVLFSVDTSAEGRPLPASAGEALCAAAGIRIAGAIEDSLEDSATPVSSDVFHAGCR